MKQTFNFLPNITKEKVFKRVLEIVTNQGLIVDTSDFSRPWGGFIQFDEKQIKKFIKLFFYPLKLDDIQTSKRFSPKLLIVAPNFRLSWQYHKRRREVWKVVEGPMAVILSKTDMQPEPKVVNNGQVVKIKTLQRHRLCGLVNWGVVAEIWLHNDPKNLSNEEDIVRLEDDFGR